MEFSWNFRGFPYCQSLFQSDAKCEAIDISLCTDGPLLPSFFPFYFRFSEPGTGYLPSSRKKKSGTPIFCDVVEGGKASVHRLIDMILMQITLFCS